MRSVFDHITRLSIRFRWLTIGLTVALMALGVYAALSLNIELLPNIELPSTYILARTHGGTSSDLMLQAYTVPIEQGAGKIDGVVNRESSTASSYAFVQILNEFGLDQEQIQEDLQTVLDDLPLPVRTIKPPQGMTPGDMIADLPPEVVLYLYVYSVQENVGFLAPLDPEVWRSFSPEVLGTLPEEAFDSIDKTLADELRARRSGDPQPLPDLTQPAPALPESWQMDRFETAQDLAELAGVRNLADIFNDFLSDGTITGPLGTTADVTPEVLQALIAIEQRCQAYSAATAHTAEADCSFFSVLDGDTMAALLTQFGAGIDGQLTDTVTLPAGYLDQLNQENRNAVAAALMAQLLTGTRSAREVLLPDEWRFEKPNLITFSLSDIPLGVLSVSADISRDELQALVDNEVVPRLEAVGLVADVTVEGGEKIRADLLNEALAAEGLPLEESAPTNGSSSEAPTGAAEVSTPAGGSNPSSPSVPVEEGPALPASWAVFASQLPGIEELNTADDLLRVPGLAPSDLLNQAVSAAAASPVAAQFVQRALSDLTLDVLEYFAAHEEGFYDRLSYDTLQMLSSDVLQQLPDAVQDRARTVPAPALGQFWQQLAAEPEFAAVQPVTADNLVAFEEGAASVLNRIVADSPPALQFYAVQLINDLSPEVIEYLSAADSGFVASLDPQVFCDFSSEVLNMSAVKDRWSAETWSCTRPDGSQVALSAIAEGSEKTAAQSLISATASAREHDPDAPKLPASWPGIAGFVGAEELDTADDLFYTTDNGAIRTPSGLLNSFVRPDGQGYVTQLTSDVLLYVADCTGDKLCEQNFFDNLSDKVLTLFSDDTAAQLPENVQTRRNAALLGIYVPEEIVTRTDGDNSLLLNIYKQGDANTVEAWSEVKKALETLEADHPDLKVEVAFEQSSFIEESISGVAREGGLGAIMAVVVILIFLNFSVRSTLVTAVSIPTSVALAFVLMKWIPGNVHEFLFPMSEETSGVMKGILTFLLRLFPESMTLNIMTLSGLTVAIGRVVDDAIVVLENIYRNVQKGENQLEAVLHGTRDVSVAIFAATVTTVVVFLPIGLFGGIIGAFFLPFGLAVTYALLSSFVVAVTVVPLLAYLFIDKKSLPEVHESRMERGYRRMIRWALTHRGVVMGGATAAFVIGMIVLSQLPTAFLPSFGAPQITVSIGLPSEIDGRPTTVAMTDAKVRRMEEYLETLDGIKAVQTSVGSAGNGLTSSEAITENEATITVGVTDKEALDRLTPLIRSQAELIFNDLDRNGSPDEGQDNVTVSSASLAEQGFGGFAVVVSGDKKNPPTLAELQRYDRLIISTLENIKGLTNVESSLAQVAGSGGDTSQVYIRIDGIPAVRYTAELETKDTLGLTQTAIDAVKALDLPEHFTVGKGYSSEQQTKGFQQTFISMGIAIVIVYFVMLLTFGSPVHPVTILFSLPLAVVGAAVGLAVTGRVLGLSSVIGLLMLVGIVVTNAIVLIDRVQTNRKLRQMNTQDALVDGGATRLRPILMTAIATMVALLPLAVGLSEGAIIAAELGTVVIGGLFSSTLLTLVVVPVVYSLFDSVQIAFRKRTQRRSKPAV